jgi:hypothetical protein
VIIDAWAIVNCRNVSRWGREHMSTNIAGRFYITSSRRNEEENNQKKRRMKKETRSRNIINAWDGREKRSAH